MSERILVGTRKGSFFVDKRNAGWTPRLAGHAGAGVNFVARDPASSTLWAALGHGHWGAKLSRSTDDGQSWSDATQIKYPEGARYLATPEPSEDDQDSDLCQQERRFGLFRRDRVKEADLAESLMDVTLGIHSPAVFVADVAGDEPVVVPA